MKVYIFNGYEEHGPEDIRVAGSPEAARRILEEILHPYQDEQYRIECRRTFEQMLSDGEGSEDLGSGWGGLQLHIIEVEVT